MIKIRPFKGYRPKIGLEDKMASKPYDVIDHNEAVAIGKDNPFSFVHVIRPEIDMPYNTDPYSKDVYNKAKETLQDLIDKGHLIEEEKNVFYIYRQIMNGRVQNGIVGSISIDDYGEGRIKKHEHTRVDKEQDRINHFYYSEAHTEPVFLFHEKNQAIKGIIKNWTASNDPIYDFSQDGVRQMLWVIRERLNNDLKVAFLLHPTQIEEITAVSDAGKVMPPKSTWFEPKLLSGLFVHKF